MVIEISNIKEVQKSIKEVMQDMVYYGIDRTSDGDNAYTSLQEAYGWLEDFKKKVKK